MKLHEGPTVTLVARCRRGFAIGPGSFWALMATEASLGVAKVKPHCGGWNNYDGLMAGWWCNFSILKDDGVKVGLGWHPINGKIIGYTRPGSHVYSLRTWTWPSRVIVDKNPSSSHGDFPVFGWCKTTPLITGRASSQHGNVGRLPGPVNLQKTHGKITMLLIGFYPLFRLGHFQ